MTVYGVRPKRKRQNPRKGIFREVQHANNKQFLLAPHTFLVLSAAQHGDANLDTQQPGSFVISLHLLESSEVMAVASLFPAALKSVLIAK
jgi:hypothetical protein